MNAIMVIINYNFHILRVESNFIKPNYSNQNKSIQLFQPSVIYITIKEKNRVRNRLCGVFVTFF